MSKKLSKEELIQAILECKSNTYKHTHLRDKKNVELEQILFELQDKDLQLEEPVAEVVEVAEPVVEVPTKAAAEVKKEKPVAKAKAPENIVTLEIAKPYYYHARTKGATIRVTNQGGGDAYVGIEKVTHGDKDVRIISGATRVYENVTILACFATSQPRLIIEEL